MKNNYHFVISTERSDEKSLILTAGIPPYTREMTRMAHTHSEDSVQVFEE